MSRHPLSLCSAAILAFVLLSPVATLAPGQTVISAIDHTPDPVPAYGKIEITFSLSQSYANPYDPDEADVWIEFQSPGGQVRQHPAFWFVGYTRYPSGGGEGYTATGVSTWMGRITGETPGTWQYRIRVSDVNGNAASAWQSVTVTASANPGFVRVDPRNPRYFAFDDGSPYRPIGNNLCWAWNGAGFSVLNWQAAMANAGGNWTRYWMSKHSAEQALEWIPGGIWSGLGRYSQQISKRFDDYLIDAENRGVYAQMCLDSFNGWNTAIYANWDDNPYNTARGGMISTPIEYLTNASAKAYAKKRFRYTVARWGYSPAVLCWEFWNEVDIVGAGGVTYHDRRAEGAAWHQEMGAYIRSIDAFEHLRTTSFSNDPNPLRFPEVWNLAEMDIVESHRYSWDLPAFHVDLINQMKAYNKPAVLGEFGVQDVTVPKPGAEPFDGHLKPSAFSDPTGQTLHDTIWAAAVSESMAASWWWEEWIAPANLWSVYTRLANFLAGEDWAPLGLGATNATILSGHTLQIYGVQGSEHAYLWVRQPSGANVNGLTLRLTGLTNGNKVVEFWNPYTGAVAQTVTLPVSGGTLDLNYPNFSKDMAIKLMPEPLAVPGWVVF